MALSNVAEQRRRADRRNAAFWRGSRSIRVDADVSNPDVPDRVSLETSQRLRERLES